jgi:Flp pilus assembly protein TadD
LAVEAFSDAIRFDPTVAKYYSSRGAAQSRLGKLGEALADLGQAITLDPSDGKTFYNRGHVRLQQGDEVGAAADFRVATKRGYAMANTEVQRLLSGKETH